jgi:hypothetical protein
MLAATPPDDLQLPLRVCVAAVLAAALAPRGLKRRALAPSGAVAAFFVGLATMSASYTCGCILILFYLTSSKVRHAALGRAQPACPAAGAAPACHAPPPPPPPAAADQAPAGAQAAAGGVLQGQRPARRGAGALQQRRRRGRGARRAVGAGARSGAGGSGCAALGGGRRVPGEAHRRHCRGPWCAPGALRRSGRSWVLTPLPASHHSSLPPPPPHPTPTPTTLRGKRVTTPA